MAAAAADESSMSRRRRDPFVCSAAAAAACVAAAVAAAARWWALPGIRKLFAAATPHSPPDSSPKLPQSGRYGSSTPDGSRTLPPSYAYSWLPMVTCSDGGRTAGEHRCDNCRDSRAYWLAGRLVT
eukprot:354346-Chlamydomonas_euryale.AAC.25